MPKLPPSSPNTHDDLTSPPAPGRPSNARYSAPPEAEGCLTATPASTSVWTSGQETPIDIDLDSDDVPIVDLNIPRACTNTRTNDPRAARWTRSCSV
ncbi:hypothetical protein H0H92_011229 [Tricholoma furcatifolium]|nr:hypothetical protein H0H92_011229 [Tricholoma furcatifolium]